MPPVPRAAPFPPHPRKNIDGAMPWWGRRFLESKIKQPDPSTGFNKTNVFIYLFIFALVQMQPPSMTESWELLSPFQLCPKNSEIKAGWRKMEMSPKQNIQIGVQPRQGCSQPLFQVESKHR